VQGQSHGRVEGNLSNMTRYVQDFGVRANLTTEALIDLLLNVVKSAFNFMISHL